MGQHFKLFPRCRTTNFPTTYYYPMLYNQRSFESCLTGIKITSFASAAQEIWTGIHVTGIKDRTPRHGSIQSEAANSSSEQNNMSMEAKPFLPPGMRSVPISDTNSNPSPRRLRAVAQ